MKRFITGTASLLTTLIVLLAPAHSQTFPSRPITIVVPFTPGGATDIVMRLVGEKLQAILGQPLVIDNRPGGAGTVGAVTVKQALPDGYTLFFGHAGTHAINPSLMAQLPYDPVRDFAPVTNLMAFPHFLVVPAASPAKSVADLVALARSRPDGLTYASQGVGTGGHVMGEIFRAKTNIKLVHVPYKGGAPAALDTVAGRVDLFYSSYLTAGPFIREGKLRVLAYASERRSPILPDVPTMAEAGYPGVELDFWFGVFAPAGTPKPIVDQLNGAFGKAAGTPEVVKMITDQAAEIVTGTPDAFADLVAKDSARLGPIMKASGAKLD